MRNVLEQMKKGYRAARRLVAGSLAFVMILSCMPAADVYAEEAVQESAVYTQEEAQTALPETESEEEAVLQEKAAEDAPADPVEVTSSDADTTSGEEAAKEAETEAEDEKLLNEYTEYTVTTTDSDGHPIRVEYINGVGNENGTDYVIERTKKINVKIDCDRNPEGNNNYVVTDVSATIGGVDADVNYTEPQNDPQYGGSYEISGSSWIEGNVVITVKTQKIHFVDFYTGTNNTQIGCSPAGEGFIPNPNFNNEHGVYVFDGKELSFSFNVNKDYRVTRVTQSAYGELQPTGPETCSKSDTVIKTGTYKTGEIHGRTTINVESEAAKVNFVEFFTNQYADQIAINPDGGDFIANPNFNSEHGVYVYAGGTLSFHYRTNRGYRVTKVTQGKNGTELTASGFDLYKVSTIESPSYTTGQINANTTIYTDSEKKGLHEVAFFDRDNNRNAEPVPDGGDIALDPSEVRIAYVYDGGKLSFHFKEFGGYVIKSVKEFGEYDDPETDAGKDLTETGTPVYEGAYTKTGSYTIDSVGEDKKIYFQT